MNKPQQVDVSLCRNYLISDYTRKYTSKDVILYALGIGAPENATDTRDLKHTYERANDFQALPSFATAIPNFYDDFNTMQQCPGLPEFDLNMMVHGEHKVIIHKPIPTEAYVHQRCVIKDVEDKTTGALVILHIETTDMYDNTPLCTNIGSLFIRGKGGFDKNKKKGKGVKKDVHTSPPDCTYTKQTTPQQAVIYRLSGDFNPQHIDPQMALKGGFTPPLLQGLCSYGISTHGVVKKLLNNDGSEVTSIYARFSSIVTPGDVLETKMWRHVDNTNTLTCVYFTTTNITTGRVCLTDGCIQLRNKQTHGNSKI
uniref:Hydroxysteroid 17-beta dehydrogenase 4 n=1 Tax=Nephromyces sp. MMRI TaxID=2496275 RepID=A0A3Q8UBL6_9APIC|nr:hydroxysteroid 17-beta dehydrogenase 4 [Nephromyces sp. MMRI]